MGLVSPGGVHSHQDHAVDLAKIIADAGIPVFVHIWTDGRDTPPQSAGEDVARFLAALPREVAIATVCGRYYAMDRDKRWERVSKAYAAMVEAEGPRFADAPAVIADAYGQKKFDEFIIPAVIGDYTGMRDGDGILSFNFRADRVREILAAMLDPAFAGFPRPRTVKFAAAVGMTQYSEALDKFMQSIFPPQSLTKILGEVVAAAGRTQFASRRPRNIRTSPISSTADARSRFRARTASWCPRPRSATYDLQPEMSAPELTDKIVAAIDSGKYDLIVLNYANTDMVGHTGSLPAAIKAVETVDAALGRIAEAIERAGGALLVTADHGNCEMMRDPVTGEPHTAHTTNPVPLFLIGAQNRALVTQGRLADIAPTLLELMDLPKPPEMTGVSLLRAGEHEHAAESRHRIRFVTRLHHLARACRTRPWPARQGLAAFRLEREFLAAGVGDEFRILHGCVESIAQHAATGRPEDRAAPGTDGRNPGRRRGSERPASPPRCARGREQTERFSIPDRARCRPAAA